MSERASVLYDIPGPRARRVNLIVSVIFAFIRYVSETAVIRMVDEYERLYHEVLGAERAAA